LFSKKA